MKLSVSRRSRRWLKLAVACALLGALYAAADWRRVGHELTNLDGTWLTLALLMFVPQTVVSALRWRSLVAPVCPITVAESARQTLAASAFNLILPSKLGDLSKAAMLPVAGSGPRATAGALAIVEKVGDVLCLLLLAACGAWAGSSLAAATGALAPLLIVPMALVSVPMVWRRTTKPAWLTWPAGRGLPTGPWVARFVLLTGVLWLLHLAQIHAFLLAAGVDAPWQVSFARVPLAIFAGLLPITLCGLGTRDSALVWLFADVAPASTMAVVGLLTALRYLVPGAVGIPLVMTGRRATPSESR